MKKSWILKAAGVAAMALLLVGCGKSATTTNTKKAAEPVKITYWHRMTGSYKTALDHLIKQFNDSQKQYKVVGVSQGSYDALQQKIMAAAKSKTLPTLSQTPYTNIGDYVKNDFLIPFDDQMLNGDNKLSAAQLADIYPSFLESGKYQGKYYGLPFSVSTSILFYNKDLMTKYNVQLPKTWDDVATAGKILKPQKLTAMALDNSYDVTLESMAQQAGHQLITKDLKANLNAPTTLAAVNKLLTLRKDGYLQTAGQDWYFDVALINKKAVFGVGSSASIPDMAQHAPKDMNWGTATIPSYNGNTGTPLNGNDNVMFKGATKAQQAGAWAFNKFLLKAESTAYWAEKTGYVPVTKSGTDSQSYQDYLKQNPAYQAAVDAVPASFGSTIFAGYNDYRNQLMSTVDLTLTKNKDGKTAFDELQAKTEPILKAAK
ncbi:ABC transporter substrate-binding protein [Lacticaseibacillus mingshuiensis]|uniref:ABC transporter substrate-binding protein n=1 Tax=Lacticaseibacillus mingshuiensis TaxID=2799574 RepID=A0ABW4CHQ1_9LACO|nr:ABC transporter substrate-binding protein [Lacticaseibacillus mingshuiensis]